MTLSVENLLVGQSIFPNGMNPKPFKEHEISGDVLLEVDNQTMKEDMGIVAFGKRKKLELAIAELRRPSSLSSGASMRHLTQTNSTSHSHQMSVSTGYSLNSPMSSAFTGQGASFLSMETPPFTGELTMTPASSDFGGNTIVEKVGVERCL